MDDFLADDFDYDGLYKLLSKRLDIGQLLNEFGIKRVSESGSNISADCPYHDDHTVSWGINCDPESDKWGYHGCFSCHIKGNIATLARDFIDTIDNYKDAIIWLSKRCGLIVSSEDEILDMVLETKTIKERKSENVKVDNDPLWIKSLKPAYPESDVWKYLTDRKLTFAQIVQSGARIGVGKLYGGRVIFPIVNHRGKLVSFYARDITRKHEKKGLYPKGAGSLRSVLYGRYMANLIDYTAYLVEGIFDVFAVQRSLQRVEKNDSNVFAVFKSSLSDDQVALLESFDRIVVIPDMKGKSEGLVPSIRSKLSNKEILIVEPDIGHDPDSLPEERLDDIILRPKSVYESKVRVYVSYDLPK